MNDLVELIATHEDAVVGEWCRAVREQPESVYAQLDDPALVLTLRDASEALIRVMQTGDTAASCTTIVQNTRQRLAEGHRFADTLAAWLIYRPVIQTVLRDALDAPNAWDQLVDRVDSVLDWVAQVIHAEYAAAQQL